jgi:hypothetical protein
MPGPRTETPLIQDNRISVTETKSEDSKTKIDGTVAARYVLDSGGVAILAYYRFKRPIFLSCRNKTDNDGPAEEIPYFKLFS